MDGLISIAEQFHPVGKVSKVQEFGNGNVNTTFLVTAGSQREERFILQRLNTQVFLRPDLVMQNIRNVSNHITQQLKKNKLGAGRRWEVVHVLLTRDGKDHWLDSDGSFWRALSFIDGACSFDTIQNLGHAEEVGHALGLFHKLVSNLPHESLTDTLEGFHVTPLYMKHYHEVLNQRSGRESSAEKYCKEFVSKREGWASVLEDAKVQGKLVLSPIHGDPKVNNILIDDVTGQAVSIIDLDTVKPGLIHYDIGDCLRSGCNPLGEEVEEWEKIYFDLDACRAILHGYLSAAKDFLTVNDFAYLFDAIRLIAFELGLRFFTDYLEGNVYFKVNHPKHNLDRALVQFKLTESIEFQEASIRSIIEDMQ